MTQEERQFIVSVKEGKTQWDLLGVPGIENLPAVQWKLQNIRRMAPRKHQEALRKLRDYLAAYSRAFDTPWSTPLQVAGNYRTS